jgi:hypothetical protein
MYGIDPDFTDWADDVLDGGAFDDLGPGETQQRDAIAALDFKDTVLVEGAALDDVNHAGSCIKPLRWYRAILGQWRQSPDQVGGRLVGLRGCSHQGWWSSTPKDHQADEED